MSKCNKLCIISHSGGLDSTTLMAKALAEGFIVQPITFYYGQKHDIEITAQVGAWGALKEMHPDTLRLPINLNLESLLGSIKSQYQSLRDSKTIEEKTELEYYTPFRNLVFSSLAAMVGEIVCLTEDLEELYVGIGVHKHSSDSYKKDYWDITPQFVDQLNQIFALNDSLNCYVYAPYADKFKEAIIRDAIDLDVPYKLTWTCYDPVIFEMDDSIQHTPCNVCEACKERESQAQKCGINDINDYSISMTRITNL